MKDGLDPGWFFGFNNIKCIFLEIFPGEQTTDRRTQQEHFNQILKVLSPVFPGRFVSF